MRTRSQTGFAALQTEGAILPADLLRRIAEGDASLGGLDSGAYHLPAGERLSEVVSRSWSRLQGSWAAFKGAQERLPETDTGTTLTREKWLLPLFQELGYGRLTPAKPFAIGEKSYGVSHGWQHTPLHLVSFRLDLDKRQPGAAGASRSSPHSLVQELLNRSDDHLWGIVSNGLRLRILRDNASLSRQAFVEFDLEAVFNGELYADFALLWLLCHQSRVEGDEPESCWLEKWSKSAKEQGTRALDRLRTGVEEAIRHLGSGLLGHPANTRLRADLQAGALSAQDFYRELLRHAYRLIFLFVAEDRDLLHLPKASAEVRARYGRFFSTHRLRVLAIRSRGSRHGDLFRSLRLVTSWLGSDGGRPELGVPALGGALFSTDAVRATGQCEVTNRDFLAALRSLSFAEDGGIRRAIDYRNLGAEELGSIYESLLELHPRVNVPAAAFTLETTPGHERKTTSSYYTHPRLVSATLDSSLVPLLERAAASSNAEAAILALRVCDPACGSGHFLIAAAHRIARALASVRTGEAEPPPEVVRSALREVISRCVYGVDLNPMAVELCRVSLWMEALEPGKPLGFLDHHVRCGNALVGATPELIAGGIPDAAFEPLEWQDSTETKRLRLRNKGEREGLGGLFADVEREEAKLLREAAGIVAEAREDSVREVRAKEAQFRRLTESEVFQRQLVLADAWTAAFFMEKEPGRRVPTTDDLRSIARGAEPHPTVREGVERVAGEFAFFHWHLAFPEVESEAGGFDVVLGNPPWDTLSPDTKEFFSPWDPLIRNADSKTQKAIVERLLEAPDIAEAWESYCRRLYAEARFFKSSGRFRLFAPGNLGKGDFNVYRMFVEVALRLARPKGYAAQVVPENLYNGANAMAIRKALFEEFSLARLFGFENTKEVWFKGIHSAAKFCLYAARKEGRTESFASAFNIRSEERLTQVLAGSHLAVPVALVPEFSPDALAVMEFSSQLEIDIARKMYARWPKFGDPTAGPQYRQYMREVDMGTDRELFDEDPAGVPVYEGRMVGQFDHRAKAYRSGRGRAAEWEELPWDRKAIVPQWHIPKERIPAKLRSRYLWYRVGFCDVASPTNERSLVASLVPGGTIAGHSVPTFTFEEGLEWAYMLWLAVANSFVLDFVARMKVSLHMSLSILDSLPIPRLSAEDPVARRLVLAAAKLSCTGPEMEGYREALSRGGFLERPGDLIGTRDPDERSALRAEIDAVVARDLYGLDKEEVSFILDGFPIVRGDDEAVFGEFRTKRLILEEYERPR